MHVVDNLVVAHDVSSEHTYLFDVKQSGAAICRPRRPAITSFVFSFFLFCFSFFLFFLFFSHEQTTIEHQMMFCIVIVGIFFLEIMHLR